MALFDEQHKQQIANLLPRYITPERFFSLAEVAMRQKAIRECTPESVLRCFIQAAEIGLEPNTPFGHCYLIPFRNAKLGRTFATLVIGWRGMVDKAIRCGAATNIVANVVRMGDTFKYRPVDPLPILHEPQLDADDSDDDSIIGAYAIAFLPGGERQAEWMSRKQIDRIRARSKAKDDGPWVTDFAEMARKCPTRRLFKYLRTSAGNEAEVERFGKALDLDSSMFESAGDDDEPPPQIAAAPPKAEAKRGPGRPPKAQAQAPSPTPEPSKPTLAPAPETPPQELCGYCHKPGHTYNECPENGAEEIVESEPIESPAPAAAPTPSVPPNGAAQTAAPDRVLSPSEYDEIMGEARKAHPNKTMSWLLDILQDNFAINDLGDLKISQIAKLSERMLLSK
jgi:recombination protein RecT